MDKLYPMDGERAFRALERIKPSIRVWWTQGPQSVQLLRGEKLISAHLASRCVELLELKCRVEKTRNEVRSTASDWGAVARGNAACRIGAKASFLLPRRLSRWLVSVSRRPMALGIQICFKFIEEKDAQFMPTFPVT